MPVATEAIKLEIAGRPIEIGVGHINRGRGDGAAGRRMNRGRSGIGKQVEEAFTAGALTDQGASQAMIQEQAGIQIIVKIHPKLQAIFLDDMELAGLRLLFILCRALLPFAYLETQLLRRYLQNRQGSRHGVNQPTLRSDGVDSGRRRVFLHVDPQFAFARIEVDGHGIFRKIGIVKPVAGNSALPGPAAQMLEILAQAVGEHRGTALGEIHGPRLAEQPSSFTFRLAEGTSLMRGKKAVLIDLEIEQLARQRAIVERVLSGGAYAELERHFRIAGEHAGPPTAKIFTQGLADFPVERLQGGFVAQAFAIGRIDDQQAVGLTRSRLAHGFALDVNEPAQSGAFQIA